MFSSQEIATAVKLGCQITHFIWNDGKYGRSAGVELGGVDFVKFAETFGAKGLRVNRSGDMERVMREALDSKGV